MLKELKQEVLQGNTTACLLPNHGVLARGKNSMVGLTKPPYVISKLLLPCVHNINDTHFFNFLCW